MLAEALTAPVVPPVRTLIGAGTGSGDCSERPLASVASPDGQRTRPPTRPKAFDAESLTARSASRCGQLVGARKRGGRRRASWQGSIPGCPAPVPIHFTGSQLQLPLACFGHDHGVAPSGRERPYHRAVGSGAGMRPRCPLQGNPLHPIRCSQEAEQVTRADHRRSVRCCRSCCGGHAPATLLS